MAENSKKPHISPSQIASYTRCGEAYRRRYLKREIIPPKIVAAKGTAVHKGAEHNFRQKVDSREDLRVSEVVDMSVATFEETIKREGVDLNPEEETRGKAIVVGEAVDSVTKMAKLMMNDVAPRHQPVAVETEQIINLPTSTHDLKGILDLENDKEEIVDLKTSGKAWTQQRADTDGQFTFYSMMKRAKSGQDPKAIIIENIVSTKKPYVATIKTTRTMEDYEPMINRINAVVEGINKQLFAPASDGSWWCSSMYCGYWFTCPYVNNKRSQGNGK